MVNLVRNGVNKKLTKALRFWKNPAIRRHCDGA
jgi:hypothetical protein